jgi:L-ribulokinase
VVAGADAGGHASFDDAMRAMTGVQEGVFEPDAARRATYDRLYALYRRTHDAFGVEGAGGDMYGVMKELLAIRDGARR